MPFDPCRSVELLHDMSGWGGHDEAKVPRLRVFGPFVICQKPGALQGRDLVRKARKLLRVAVKPFGHHLDAFAHCLGPFRRFLRFSHTG